MYTAARLERLYGPEAARWSVSVTVGERLAADPKAVIAIGEAAAIAKAQGRIEAKLAGEVVDGLQRMALKRVTSPSPTLPQYLSDALKHLIQSKSYLAELDEIALQRVIDKGPNVNLMKGELLEELLESRIASWLRDPAGTAALGLARPPRGLEFIPGHLIRDAAGRQSGCRADRRQASPRCRS